MPSRFVEVPHGFTLADLTMNSELFNFSLPALNLSMKKPSVPSTAPLAAILAAVVLFVGNTLLSRALARRALADFGAQQKTE